MPGKSKGPRPKHVPLRTCVVCRTTRPKRELVRVVRTLVDTVEVDPTGKMAGRGAYVCRQRECWEQAFKRRSLEHALQTAISPDNKAVLQQFGSEMPQEQSE
ncbi:MAG: YlxR family protein [Chloroflexi bacterium]|nr:YlxR family protein [Chloroflexota bacterium]MCL5109317.1 YlxR family protein [Chloroflexota bacterium]